MLCSPRAGFICARIARPSSGGFLRIAVEVQADVAREQGAALGNGDAFNVQFDKAITSAGAARSTYL